MMNALHPEFRQHADALLEMIEYAKAETPEPEKLWELIEQDDSWHAAYSWAMTYLVNNRVAGLGGSAYGVPFLHPEVCSKLVAEAVRLGEVHGHRPNLEEDSPYQIPEIVVKHVAPELHEELAGLIEYLNIWFMLIYQVAPTSISSIQFAKYEPNGTAHGNWHHDRDSSFTAVVSLAPELFTGGGTDLRLSPTEFYSVAPLPPGFALIMNGKQLHHRGRAVESGVRHLLVFWLDSCADSVSISQTATVE